MNYDDELYHDAQIDLENETTCQYCNGTGANFTRDGQAFRCPDCHGTGEEECDE